jgi:hypothetical protein
MIICTTAPYRPWGLGSIRKAGGFFYQLTGKSVRTPGIYRKIDPHTGKDTAEFLEDTNERIHPSVRIRLAVGALGLNDRKFWDCPALLSRWRLAQTSERFNDPIPAGTNAWGPTANGVSVGVKSLANDDYGHGDEAVLRPPSPGAERHDKKRWVWEYHGPEGETAPPVRTILEETLGPYERHLLKISGGEPNVYAFAEGGTVPNPIVGTQTLGMAN